MGAIEVTAQVLKNSTPFIDLKCIALTYVKGAQADFATLSSYGIKTIVFATAKVAGADDPCTWATNVLTLTTATGAGSAIVWGSC